ncbi:hypothetical protein WMF04_25785 [Sorangium sp. So ce260]|uniref:hypothetical protein n=1 Tax=Sorangium sp. So ce260 TaxID=3133291 RepID=UPI003F646DEA
MKAKPIILFAGSAVMAAVVSMPEMTSAAWRQYPASICAGHFDQTAFWPNGSLMATEGDGTFICPIIEDSSFNKTHLTTVSVTGRDRNTDSSVSAKVCQVDIYGVGAAACGSTAVSNADDVWTGNFDLRPSLPWNEYDAYDFAYISIGLPMNQVSAPNYQTQVTGIFYSG